MTALDIPTLRKALRNRRKQLTPQQQQAHAKQACQAFIDSQLLMEVKRNVKRIGVFLSQDGELDTQALIDVLWKTPNIEVYLPVLNTQPDWPMGFLAFTAHSKMIKNRFNIPQ